MKYFTFLSGIEGVGVGARMAGGEHAGGIEIEPEFANIANRNGFNVTLADATVVNPNDFPDASIFHVSPVCTRMRPQGINEIGLDIAVAEATVRWITVKRPEFVTVENVYLYRKTKSWQMIEACLVGLGYGVKYWNLNAFDYGAPQNRRRMIAIARRDGRVPQKPTPTEYRVGWAEALAGLLDDLEPDTWPKWTIPRLPVDYDGDFMFHTGNRNFGQAAPGNGVRLPHEPAATVTAGMGKKDSPIRFRLGGQCLKASLRCYARLQSFPDSYWLPETHTKGVGNAVPPLLYKAVYESLQGAR